MSKLGLLVYEDHFGVHNIGDYIQSIAARQFIQAEQEITYINREHLNIYKGENIKLIMNGWFLHRPENWPPSVNIKSFIISFHINPSAYQILENPGSIDFFKANEPIGCRDLTTLEVLRNMGINCYFSGCLTLTLNKTYGQYEKNDKLLFVDPYFSTKKNLHNLIHALITLVVYPAAVFKICNKKYEKTSWSTIFRSCLFVYNYLNLFKLKQLTEATYFTHLIKVKNSNDYNRLFDIADQLLKEYAQARLVITSRIHCALPCLSFDSPVIFTENNDDDFVSKSRFEGIVSLFNVVKFGGKGISSKSITYNADNRSQVINPKNHIGLRDRLNYIIKSFVQSGRLNKSYH